MEIRTSKDCTLNEILNAFNKSFSDYFIPLQLTPDQLADKIKTEKVVVIAIGKHQYKE